ncbi:MAG: hypothetical protein FRX49_05354 [Trebouxia sp. A1-2]|nr:MAG: hypothetical protein FRX49_05354 [Trebouxia sp. A1-2]
MTAAINRRIQRRLRIFQFVTIAACLFPKQDQGSGDRLHRQMLWVMYWLTICMLVCFTTWLLVVQPVRSAKQAAKEHEAWLDEPQEMATFESSKTVPLLEESKDGKQIDNLQSAKDVASNYNDKKTAGSVADKKPVPDAAPDQGCFGQYWLSTGVAAAAPAAAAAAAAAGQTG